MIWPPKNNNIKDIKFGKSLKGLVNAVFFIFLTTDIFMICILSASQFASLQVKLWHKWIQCGLRGCYYLWWNPCLLSVTFFLKTTRKVFNKVAPLPLLCSFWFRWSSIVCNFCERGRRSRKGVGSGSRRLKGFNVPRGELAASPWKTTAVRIFTGHRFGRTASHLDTNQSNCGSRAGAPAGPQASKVWIWRFFSARDCQPEWEGIFEVRVSGKVVREWNPFCDSLARLAGQPEIFSAFSAESRVLFENISFRKYLLKRERTGLEIRRWYCALDVWWNNSWEVWKRQYSHCSETIHDSLVFTGSSIFNYCKINRLLTCYHERSCVYIHLFIEIDIWQSKAN